MTDKRPRWSRDSDRPSLHETQGDSSAGGRRNSRKSIRVAVKVAVTRSGVCPPISSRDRHREPDPKLWHYGRESCFEKSASMALIA